MYAYAANASVVNPLQIINLDEMKVEDIPALKSAPKLKETAFFTKMANIYLGLKRNSQK